MGVVITLAMAGPVRAEDEFYQVRVTKVVRNDIASNEGQLIRYHTVEGEVLNGEKKGERVTIENTQTVSSVGEIILEEGDVAVTVYNGTQWQVVDKYRLPALGLTAIIFLGLVVALARWKGVGAIIGMAGSLWVIVKFIVPQILDGKNPVAVSIGGAIVIMTGTIYLAHGFSKRTTVALAASYISLALVGILAGIMTDAAVLSGLGSEDAWGLQFGPTAQINLKGLMLGGVIIGALGVLDDITTSLSATVFEVAKANPTYSLKRLAMAGMEVGREHITSLVNTLVLAYAGVSLPIFLYLVVNINNYPWWFILNSESFGEEIVRTIAGSMGLVAAVPLTAVMAAWAAGRKKV